MEATKFTYSAIDKPDCINKQKALNYIKPTQQPRITVCGVGYDTGKQREALGLTYHKKDKFSPYRKWVCMLNRCYGKNISHHYIGCRVCPDWHDYQIFADWYVNQPYSRFADAQLDKDILDPSNMIYCPQYCCVVPRILNLTFRSTKYRLLPRGVTFHHGKFRASISLHGKVKHLGVFNSPKEAADAYAFERKLHERNLASFYDGILDPRVLELLRK